MSVDLETDWDYTGEPGTVPRDQVRELVGDTDKNTKLVSDTTIELALENQGGNERMAAAKIAEKIGARFVKEAVNKSGKDYSRTMDRSKAFFELAKMLRESDPSAVGYAAQLRRSKATRLYGDNDIRRGAFRTGMFHTSEFDPRTEFTDQDILDNARNQDD